MVKTPATPDGLPRDVFDGFRATGLMASSRSRAKVDQGIIDNWWRQGMMGSGKAQYDCIKAFSETDTTDDPNAIDHPTLVLHGKDDQIVPIATSALMSAKMLKNATLKTYPGLPHGMATKHAADIIRDVLAFVRS